MSDVIIRTHAITKAYRMLDKPWHRLLEGLGIAQGVASLPVLKPTTLEIVRGQSVGIVGRNGSGKSTLLSIIAGILTPTTGTVERTGRISALLELGSGFTPEFTGRDNVFFSGALMGLSRDEMSERFADIAAFAEIGDFIDRPVKTYSSGMFVRLAFATAINVSPDVLIVDEALSVGDIYFQQKCFERLRAMRNDGVTLLFVSHDSSAITRFCDRAILMEHGEIVLDSDPPSVIRNYESRLIAQRDAAAAQEADVVPKINEILDPNVTIEQFELVDADGRAMGAFVSEERVTIRAALRFHSVYADPHCGFKIRNRFGEVIFETNTYCVRTAIGSVVPGDRVVIDFHMNAPLVQGEYTLSLGVADGGYGEGLFEKQLVYTGERFGFKVLRNINSIQWSGVANLFPECSIQRPSASRVSITTKAIP
jgi:lipopolysaccharide transport system ATP-binding protein